MYIYKTTNLINNKIYIGLSTKSVEESTDYYGSGRVYIKSFNKYGKKYFKKEILESNILSIERLEELEIFYISKFNSTDRSIGYNVSTGGSAHAGSKHSEETKALLSEKQSSHKLYWNPIDKKKTWSAEDPGIPWVLAAGNNSVEYKRLDGRKKYHNPETGERICIDGPAPIGFIKGIGKTKSKESLSEEHKKNLSKGKKGAKMYYSPSLNKGRYFMSPPMDGDWVPYKRKPYNKS